jgi:DNA-directed RNA polymerase specialized sigma24 family protein
VGELEELVREAAAGDRSAFASLMEPHMSAAYRAALAVLGSPDDAREAVQEAALRAWQRLPQLRDASAFPAWFRRIVTRAALDVSRRAYRVRELTLPHRTSRSTKTLRHTRTIQLPSWPPSHACRMTNAPCLDCATVPT